ncbi:hypothetical protein [Aeromonas caviae]|uniref:hypothetical protein n=1 Tax=Aeromonas caviae TaxID=648 RepID=UPI003EC797D1
MEIADRKKKRFCVDFIELEKAGRVVESLSGKILDGGDLCRPEDPGYAIAWLVSANSEQELAAKLAEVCAVLPLPEWCATLRRLTAENKLMDQPVAAMVPRWKAGDPLIWDPLRRHLLVSAARSALQQSEGNSPSPDTTRAKLAALTNKRTPASQNWTPSWPPSRAWPENCGAGTVMAIRRALPPSCRGAITLTTATLLAPCCSHQSRSPTGRS